MPSIFNFGFWYFQSQFPNLELNCSFNIWIRNLQILWYIKRTFIIWKWCNMLNRNFHLLFRSLGRMSKSVFITNLMQCRTFEKHKHVMRLSIWLLSSNFLTLRLRRFGMMLFCALPLDDIWPQRSTSCELEPFLKRKFQYYDFSYPRVAFAQWKLHNLWKASKLWLFSFFSSKISNEW